MHYIFPLMVFKQAGAGLDFRSVRTTCIFNDKDQVVGAVSWRIHQPAIVPLSLRLGCGLPTVSPTLEVLFIAVQERKRGREYGSMLVRFLEQQAKTAVVQPVRNVADMDTALAVKSDGGLLSAPSASCALIYVEIGFEVRLGEASS